MLISFNTNVVKLTIKSKMILTKLYDLLKLQRCDRVLVGKCKLQNKNTCSKAFLKN